MKIVVNDTNVFIDLLAVDLLDKFMRLPIEVHTTDLIVEEFTNADQRTIIDKLINDDNLKIKSFSFSELTDINNLYSEIPKLSIPDCSVLQYSLTNGYTLLTGDGPLRSSANTKKVDVKGLLYIFDELIKYQLITSDEATAKLMHLIENGTRIPKKIVIDKINEWTN